MARTPRPETRGRGAGAGEGEGLVERDGRDKPGFDHTGEEPKGDQDQILSPKDREIERYLYNRDLSNVVRRLRNVGARNPGTTLPDLAVEFDPDDWAETTARDHAGALIGISKGGAKCRWCFDFRVWTAEPGSYTKAISEIRDHINSHPEIWAAAQGPGDLEELIKTRQLQQIEAIKNAHDTVDREVRQLYGQQVDEGAGRQSVVQIPLLSPGRGGVKQKTPPEKLKRNDRATQRRSAPRRALGAPRRALEAVETMSAIAGSDADKSEETRSSERPRGIAATSKKLGRSKKE